MILSYIGYFTVKLKDAKKLQMQIIDIKTEK